jgi:mono/diheme cytochrome c family protein
MHYACELARIQISRFLGCGICFFEFNRQVCRNSTIRNMSLQMRITAFRVAVIAAGLASGMSPAAIAQGLPPGNGQAVVQSACTACHGIDVIVSQRHTADEWRDVVSEMVGNGASLTDDQFATVVKYLGTTLASQSSTPANTAR